MKQLTVASMLALSFMLCCSPEPAITPPTHMVTVYLGNGPYRRTITYYRYA